MKNDIKPPTLSFNFAHNGNSADHHPEGRIIIAEFDHVLLLSCYVPNNGTKPESFQRRVEWDNNVSKFLVDYRNREPFKPVIYQGDLNVAKDEEDVSGDASWWSSQFVSAEFDSGDCGQPGFTLNERMRFKQLCDDAGLVDPWAHLHRSGGLSNEIASSNDGAGGEVCRAVNGHFPIFTWRGTEGGRYFGKGMRIDYTLVSREMLEYDCVEESTIHGQGHNRINFFGSDHCPVSLTLRDEWWTKILHCQQLSTGKRYSIIFHISVHSV